MADNPNDITGVPTGFYDLDRMTSGLQAGDLVVLAARPSMGKTALAVNIAEHVALNEGLPVAVFSMEMAATELVRRMMCARAGVDSQKLKQNRLNAEECGKVISALVGLQKAPIFIDDTPGLTVGKLRALARRHVQRNHAKLIVVDYLQLMTAPESARENRQQEVSAISRGIKALARELNVPILCLSQLNRAAEAREGHRPRMSDLRESGSLEQDADAVWLLHREEYYHLGDEDWFNGKGNDKYWGTGEIIVAKNRNGPTGTVPLTWNNTTTRFGNHAEASKWETK
jgi:replicative DNA helicase